MCVHSGSSHNEIHMMKILKYLLLAGVACSVFTLAVPLRADAQIDLAGEILRAGTEDANLLFKEYIRPFAEGFGADLNSGWFSRAKPNDALRLDIMIRTGIAVVPVANRSFNIDDIPLVFLDPVGGAEDVPTAFGTNTEGPEMRVEGFNPSTREWQELGRFTMPGGTGYPYVPAPIIQAGLGVGLDTEFIVRYVPPVTMQSTKVSTNGFGIKHRMNQWLPGGGDLPVDITLHAGFSQLSATVQLDVRPDEGLDIYNPHAGNPAAWSGQAINLEAVGFSGNLIVGKSLGNLSLFGSIGIQTSRMNLNTPGGFPVTSFNLDYDSSNSTEQTRRKRVERIVNPVSLEFKDPNLLFGSAGLSIDIDIFVLSGSVAVSNYTVLNLGVGLSL